MESHGRAEGLGGIAVIGALTTGAFALVAACGAILTEGWGAGGMALVAAAVAFAGVANAIFRH